MARPVSVFAILSPFKAPIRQQLLVSWSGLRGAASIVFAIMATVSPAYTNENDVFHIVIFIVLFSISIQGSLLGLVAKKLDMIDDTGNVMKTFSDYSDEMPVEFIKIAIRKNHPWAGKKIMDILSLPDVLGGARSARGRAYRAEWKYRSSVGRYCGIECAFAGGKSGPVPCGADDRKGQFADRRDDRGVKARGRKTGTAFGQAEVIIPNGSTKIKRETC